MKVWNNFNIIQANGLSFTKIRKNSSKVVGKTGRIYFYNPSNKQNGGYIDIFTSICYYRTSNNKQYTATDLNNYKTTASFVGNMVISSYDNEQAANDYLYYSDSVGTTIKKTHSEYRMRQKEQVKPTDNSQDWIDTGRYRDSPDFDVLQDSCHCGQEYVWTMVGYLCDGINKCKKYRLQYKPDCSSIFIDYTPIIEKIGEIVEQSSSECGTHEYEEVKEGTICGSEANELYGQSFPPFNKYETTYGYIRSYIGDWERIHCDGPIKYDLLRENSFECGYYETRDDVETSEQCGSYIKTNYPTVPNIVDTNKYTFKIIHKMRTSPYPTNTDEMSRDEWVWFEENTEYQATILESNSCECGYFYLKNVPTDEYICGSELGEGYVSTTQYRKHIEYKYCGETQLEATGNQSWQASDSQSCECGYRVTGYSIDTTYEYICGDSVDSLDNGYMYYKKYKFTSCTDGSNKVFDKTDIQYAKASHSSVYEDECLFDADTNANTTLKRTTYRTYYDENEQQNVKVFCNNEYIVLSVTETKKSSSCGYKERWIVDGEVCCGNIDFNNQPTLTIVSTEGAWIREGNKFTSNKIGNSQSTVLMINFSLNVGSNVYINYDISSEGCCDKLYTSKVMDEPVASGTSVSYSTVTGGTKQDKYNLGFVNGGNHTVYLKYQKDSSVSSGRDNVIVNLTASNSTCTEFSRYNLEVFEYSIDSGTTWLRKDPSEYRYGSLIETNSEKCGYIPKLVQWKRLCPDITADDYKKPEDIDDCVVCKSQSNAPTLFAKEYEQESTDGGITWVNTGNERSEQMLKWKSPACGYTGDTYEYRWTDVSCDGVDLWGTRTSFVSYDNGANWEEVPNSTVRMIKEENSAQCQPIEPEPTEPQP